jgi:hypothetical protein
LEQGLISFLAADGGLFFGTADRLATVGLWLQVEHIVREENMMAAQEILELFCELVAVRLPIIETQRSVVSLTHNTYYFSAIHFIFCVQLSIHP